jgi:urea transporter/murein DD-endopeptidase MepM/ murein hydrolase activator NlpD
LKGLHSYIQSFAEGVVKSYSQIFFSQNKVLGLIILAVTFINPFLGACGLAGIFLINLFAILFGFDRNLVREGYFGFNALLLGLVFAFEYQFNLAFVIVFVSAILLLLFITAFFIEFLSKYKLPFLTLPFLFTYWLFYLGISNFSFISFQEQYIFVENFKATASQSPVYVFAYTLNDLPLPLLAKSYLLTLAATFFQNSVLAGIIVAIGILIFSRIAFSLTVVGFLTAFFFFNLLGVDTVFLTDYLVGSNYIFFSIAIGCFFVVPNKWTYLAVILLTPVLMVFYFSLYKLLIVFQLKSFTLAYSILTILFLGFLNRSRFHKYIQQVVIQYYSPEKTIYKHISNSKRFAHAHLAKLQLPVWGKWKVSQGYNGNITHLGDWSSALDLVIVDNKGQTFNNDGARLEDYYCYNKPVVAPLDGYVYEVVNNIDDNPVGQVNIEKNWGNTIVLNHNNGLFSQISHLKKDSFKVKVGDYVEKGTMLANCGSSGRSPEPHLHFQLQLSPKIGAKTLSYPIAYFLDESSGNEILKTFQVPPENSLISNVAVAETIKQALNFLPGQTVKLTNENDPEDFAEWKIQTDSYNRTFLSCEKTKSYVWFVNDGVMFYFYDFEGNRKSLLFQFYLGLYRILLSANTNVEVVDSFPLMYFNKKPVQVIQDFFAPFFLFSKAGYLSKCTYCDNPNQPKSLKVGSSATTSFMKRNIQQRSFEISVTASQLHKFSVISSSQRLNYTCELF